MPLEPWGKQEDLVSTPLPPPLPARGRARCHNLFDNVPGLELYSWLVGDEEIIPGSLGRAETLVQGEFCEDWPYLRAQLRGGMAPAQ